MSKLQRAVDLLNEFGIKVMAAKLLQTCTRKIFGIKYLAGKLKYQAITEFLYNENKELIEEFNTTEHLQTPMIGNESSVWVLWWQGLEQAPDIVKMCIESIRQHIGNRTLMVLSEKNYQEHVTLDNRYLEMVDQGKITRTQFSDLLRLNLLFQQGGVWLDATYLLTGSLPSYLSALPFFTIRHGMEKEYPMSKGFWTSSALAFGKGSEELKLFIDVYDAYFSKHDKVVDYLLTDYVFAVCCDHCEEIHKMFENVPMNNQNVNKLLLIMNKLYAKQLVAHTTKNSTLNKLNRRYPFEGSVKTIEKNGSITQQRTVYGHFRDIYLRGN